jgi:hypothetical protein
MTGGVIGSGTAMIIVLGKSIELNTRVIVDMYCKLDSLTKTSRFPDDATLYVS